MFHFMKGFDSVNVHKLMVTLFVAALVAFQAHGQATFNVQTIEQRVSALEKRDADRESRLAALEARCKCSPTVATAAKGDVKCELVTHADGSKWYRCCDENGCREYPYFQYPTPDTGPPRQAGVRAVACASCPGGVMYVSDGGSDPGGCSTCGQASEGGGCSSCGSGKRGLFGRRRGR